MLNGNTTIFIAHARARQGSSKSDLEIYRPKLVSKGGLEPPRPFERQPLKLVRLPISPLRRGPEGGNNVTASRTLTECVSANNPTTSESVTYHRWSPLHRRVT